MHKVHPQPLDISLSAAWLSCRGVPLKTLPRFVRNKLITVRCPFEKITLPTIPFYILPSKLPTFRETCEREPWAATGPACQAKKSRRQIVPLSRIIVRFAKKTVDDCQATRRKECAKRRHERLVISRHWLDRNRHCRALIPRRFAARADTADLRRAFVRRSFTREAANLLCPVAERKVPPTRA